MNVNKTLTREKGLILPKDGLTPHTLYICEGSASESNPVHEVLLFTGFLNKQGRPAGYSYTQPLGTKDTYSLDMYTYLKPIKKLYTQLKEK